MTDEERNQIIHAVNEILAREPQGLKASELFNRIQERLGSRIAGDYELVLQYARKPDAPVFQPARGWFRHVAFREAVEEPAQHSPAPSQAEKILEQQFYEPFARWLETDLQECTEAIVVGGNTMKDKFGTPDVVGIYRPEFLNVIQFPIEVVSAEIKTSTKDLITAFGQACSYMLFSHKSYIAVPRTALHEDIEKLESLCLIFGIGLILFDSKSPQNPSFQIRTRAAKHDPDMFYVNQKIPRIAEKFKISAAAQS